MIFAFYTVLSNCLFDDIPITTKSYTFLLANEGAQAISFPLHVKRPIVLLPGWGLVAPAFGLRMTRQREHLSSVSL